MGLFNNTAVDSRRAAAAKMASAASAPAAAITKRSWTLAAVTSRETVAEATPSRVAILAMSCDLPAASKSSTCVMVDHSLRESG